MDLTLAFRSLRRTGPARHRIGRPVAEIVQENEVLRRELEASRDREAEWRRLATHDELTGLRNRRGMKLFVENGLRPHMRATALAVVDLDDFKLVNDACGHEVGDAMLVEVASRLKEFCGDSHVAVRLGGDEFAVLLTSPVDDRDYLVWAGEVLKAYFTEPVVIEEVMPPHAYRQYVASRPLSGELPVCASIGATFIRGISSFGEALRRADIAMYAAKKRKTEFGATVVWYSKELRPSPNAARTEGRPGRGERNREQRPEPVVGRATVPQPSH